MSGVRGDTLRAAGEVASGGLLEVATGLREGGVLAGKYRIERVIGAGGMGVVVAAHHLQLDQKVAIKFLRAEALGKTDIVNRFVREARAAVRIQSEHVARILDVGTLEFGAPYIVMEFLQGSDLASLVQQRGTFGVEQAVEFVLQASEAIAEAHGLGIVHRDLKPANLFCIRMPDGRPSIKVLDFGVSKVTGRDSAGVGATQAAAVLGSPHYMSPEQMQSSRDVDARTDIWALGIILYELITGNVPFEGDSLAEVCTKVVASVPPPIRGLRPDSPAGLEEVILCCLRKDRERRYANVAELAAALIPFGPPRAQTSVERIRRVLRIDGLTSVIPSIPAVSSAISAKPSAPTPAAWTRDADAKTKTFVLGAAGFVLALLVGLGTFLHHPAGQEEVKRSGSAVSQSLHAASEGLHPTAVEPAAAQQAAAQQAAAQQAAAQPTAAQATAEPGVPSAGTPGGGAPAIEPHPSPSGAGATASPSPSGAGASPSSSASSPSAAGIPSPEKLVSPSGDQPALRGAPPLVRAPGTPPGAGAARTAAPMGIAPTAETSSLTPNPPKDKWGGRL